MLVTGAITFIGFMAAVAAVRGRRAGTELRCRRCDHLVEGLRSAVCPECGENIGHPHAVIYGTRVRYWWVAAVSLIAAVCFGTSFATKTYKTLTEQGWEHRVPGWWLGEVEMRFATGRRLDLAAMGILYGKNTKRIPEWEVKSATQNAFERYCDEVVSGSLKRPSILEHVAFMHAEDPAADQERVGWAIRQSITIEKRWPQSLEQVQGCNPGYVRTLNLPAKWILEHSYRVTDAAGQPIGNYGSGSTETHSSSGSHLMGTPKGTPPYTCTWNFKLIKRGSTPEYSIEWVEAYEFSLRFLSY